MTRRPRSERDPARPALGPIGACLSVALAIGGAQLAALALRTVAPARWESEAAGLRALCGAVAVGAITWALRRRLAVETPGAVTALAARPPRPAPSLALAAAAGALSAPLSIVAFGPRDGSAVGGASLLLVVAVTLATPIAEELLFRGTIQPALAPSRAGDRDRAALVTIPSAAILFGAYHLAPLPAVHATLLALPLGWLALRSGSVWPAVAFHGAHNAATLAWRATPEASPSTSDAGYAPLLAIAIVATLGLALCLWGFARATAPTPAAHPRP